ncbi:hypothetical protein ABEW05_002101 [Botrytis cinerea]
MSIHSVADAVGIPQWEHRVPLSLLGSVRICEADGDAKFCPATQTSSIASPGYPACAGSWPDPPPDRSMTFDFVCCRYKTSPRQLQPSYID